MLGFSSLGVQALGALVTEEEAATATIKAARSHATRSLVASASASTATVAAAYAAQPTVRAR